MLTIIVTLALVSSGVARPVQPPAAADAVAIPRMLSYQGRLADTEGNPVPDSLYAVSFRLYAAPSGGTPLWEEEQGVQTRDGLFTVLLGSVTPIGSVPDAGTLYLGMQVGASELTPRLRIASAAYAYKADTAGYALAGGSDGAWTRGVPDSVLFTVRALGIARGGAGNELLGGARPTHVNFGVACTTGVHNADPAYCTVSGGSGNAATAPGATVAGGVGNGARDIYATVAGGGANSAVAGYATVGGGSGNIASAERATVGGGRENRATGTNSTVAGGKYTVASGYCATVGGGIDNVAEGSSATVAGGAGNHASGDHAAAAGGFGNVAAGYAATVPGGFLNAGRGYGSFAAGTCARAQHPGSFVWGDAAATNTDSVWTTGPDQFVVRARGGTWFYSNGAMTTGAYLAPGSNSWAAACDSANKEDFRPVDRRELLERIAALPVRNYKMRDQDDGTRHIGPVAQDFHAAFGYGESETGINLADADGVLLAAVQALYEQNRIQQAEIEALRAQLARW